MEHLRVRCPACQKLYQVETHSIYSQSPHFDCKACHSIFSFQFPPVGITTESGPDFEMSEVPSFLVQSSSSEVTEAPAVILQAQPSLVQLWNQIFEDYDDHERHEDFVKRCIVLEALPYAQAKYHELKAALGSDDLCDKYLEQVETRLLVKSTSHVQSRENKNKAVDFQEFVVWLKARPWRKILYWAPLVSGLMMVMAGFSNLGLRNMIGLGVAVAFLGYGLITVVFGRIQISDFID